MTEQRTEALPVRYAGVEDLVNRVPVSIVWEITLACDLACQHCGSRAGRRRRDELSTAEASTSSPRWPSSARATSA